jgi:beta-galactosidase/beta-glucuronidase
LVDVDLTLVGPDAEAIDRAATYCGLRTVGTDRGAFLLNDRPLFVRSVLEQGYWAESHLTAPSPEAYRTEVELIRDLGFNAVRIHQKTEDPRFLYWADRLGLLVWGESASPYAFTPRGAARVVSEWTDIVTQYRGHPSIVTWVPVNESWGVQDLAHAPAQRSFVGALAALTRSLDPSRPVVSNDGWEHVDSDLLTIHDYTTDPDALARSYASTDALAETIRGMGPSGRRPTLTDDASRTGAPVMVSEFGGISYAGDDTWGYATVTTAEEYEQILRGLFAALNSSPHLAGLCYTQLTDTLQEANGLLHADRTPKLPIEVLRGLITGS